MASIPEYDMTKILDERNASHEIEKAVWKAGTDYKLTYSELIRILSLISTDLSNYQIRHEREENQDTKK